jgi:hypothetical protein
MGSGCFSEMTRRGRNGKKRWRAAKVSWTVSHFDTEAKSQKEAHVRSISLLQALAAEARQLERRVADLVNAAYGLTPEEVTLIGRTAPPRMPGDPPACDAKANFRRRNKCS